MSLGQVSERLKVLTLVGTRPELIKLSRVIDLLDRFTSHVLVHTGQNYAQQLNGVWRRLSTNATRCFPVQTPTPCLCWVIRTVRSP